MEQTTNYSRHKTLCSILAVVLLLWGAFGALNITKQPYTGYLTSPDNVVTLVRAGSPTEAAGLKVGDTITKIDGYSATSVAGFYERGQPAIGSQGSLTVKRNGSEQTLSFKYAAQPMAEMLATSGIGVLIGLAFLILGLLVYLKHPTRLSIIFCALSLMLALLFLPPPLIASVALRKLVFAAISFIAGVALATLLYYCLSYPREKALLAARPWLRQAIFIVAPLLGLFFAFINLMTPNISARKSMFISILAAVIYGGYILLTIVAVLHSYLKANAEERAASGLNLMLLGVVIGWGPLVIALLYHTLLPHAGELPGERFWGVTTIAVPIGMALALMKLEPATAAAQASEEAAT